MRKSNFRKVVAILLAMIMVFSLAACGGSDNQEDTKASDSSNNSTVQDDTNTSSDSGDTAEEDEGITWPLAEEVTFTIAVKNDDDVAAYLEKNEYWAELKARTNVNIEILTLPTEGTMGVLNGMFAANSGPDAILGGSIISETNLVAMVEDGFLMPLNEFIDDPAIMTNFNERVLAESPLTKGLITAPDGNIYSLPKYTALEGNYLESPLWINKTWVEQLGKSVEDIKTIEDLEEILVAFAENDMNGNGDTTDEIPYFFYDKSARCHMEAFLGLWGLATKNAATDYYVYVNNGIVNYAPTSEAYKDAMITLNRWYEKGLIWSEAFTASSETYSAKLAAELPVIGLYAEKTPIETNENYEYVLLEPVKVEGYEPLWYRHPGLLGTKGLFSVSANCENADILMKWIDEAFYSFEGFVRAEDGEEEYGRWTTTSDGKVELITISDSELDAELKENHPTLKDLFLSNIPGGFTADDYANRLTLDGSQAQLQANYAVYKDYMSDESWPRPYFTADDNTRIAELYTDISNTVAMKKAAWVTGTADVEAEWDSYVESLNKMGLEEMIEILQRTYNVYVEGIQ